MRKPKNTPKYRRVDPPERMTIGPRVHIVGADEDLKLIVLSPEIHGYMTHWNGSHTIPCLDPAEKCVGCEREMPSRYAGFVHVIPTRGGRSFFLWLTEDSVAPLVPLQQKKTLRRSIINVHRARKHIQAPLVVNVTDKLRDDQPCPEAIDPTATLMKIWATHSKRPRKST